MAEVIEGIHPTRMELLEINKKIELAVKGHKLLKEKRDTLMTEFLEVLEEAKGLKGELTAAMDVVYSDLILAEAVMGSANVESIAAAIPESKRIELSLKNVMGVRIPQVDLVVDEAVASRKDYMVPFTSTKVDDSVEGFNLVIGKLIKLVEVEETIIRLGEEIKKTKRRVNALEHMMIPQLKATQRYIKMRLEEMERENFFRLKTVKRKKEREARAS